jgi:hypothetical protein
MFGPAFAPACRIQSSPDAFEDVPRVHRDGRRVISEIARRERPDVCLWADEPSDSAASLSREEGVEVLRKGTGGLQEVGGDRVRGVLDALGYRKVPCWLLDGPRHNVLPRVLELRILDRCAAPDSLGDNGWVRGLELLHRHKRAFPDHHGGAPRNALQDLDQPSHYLVVARYRSASSCERSLRQLLERHLQEHAERRMRAGFVCCLGSDQILRRLC